MSSEKPKVLIVGAGLAGMTMGILLDKAGIPYDIYERAAEIKPLGSAMAFSAGIAPLFRQLGIMDDYESFGKPSTSVQFANEQREIEYTIHMRDQLEQFGSNGYIVSRPMFYDLLLRQIPKERLHLGTKITSTEQDENGVVIHCADGLTIKGDILVGADGAYSVVRENLYNQLRKEGSLPASDDVPLPFSTICLLGQTRPLEVEQFPNLALEKCQFINTIGDGKPYSWTALTTKQNTVCWRVIRYLDEESNKSDETFMNAEWGPEATETMAKEVREFPIISGGEKPLKVGDLIDWTPKELISKVMLEEKVFETWSAGRTVLLGDACHKFNPAGGAGAINAIHDAITLVNWFNVLPLRPTNEDLAKVFDEYKSERMPWVQAASRSSKMLRTMASSGYVSKIVRFVVKHLPDWINDKMQIHISINRPQLSFLPQVEDTGSVRPAPQPSLEKTLAILFQKNEAQNKGISTPTNAV